MAENDVDPVDPEPANSTDQLPAPEVDKSEVNKSQYIVTPPPEVLEKTKGGRVATSSRGPLKPESLSTDYVVVREPAPEQTPTSATEVIPESTPTVVVDAPTEVAPQIVYVTAPVPPKPAGNRGFGALIAVAATIIFGVLFAFAVLLILRAIRGFATMSMLGNYGFWIPVGVFLVAFLVVVLLVNRAGWWAHIIGSFIVGLVVYFLGALLITAVSVVALHQDATVAAALLSPTTVASAIIAREVALWAGVIVSFRGKRVAVRNREARAAFDAEQTSNAR